MKYEQVCSLLDYHYWARDVMLDTLEALPIAHLNATGCDGFNSLPDAAVHTYEVERAWLARWEVGGSGTIGKALFEDLAELREAWKRTELHLRTVIADNGPGGMERRFEYRTFSGRPESMSLCGMVENIVRHASHHRTEIFAALSPGHRLPPQGSELAAFCRLIAPLATAVG